MPAARRDPSCARPDRRRDPATRTPEGRHRSRRSGKSIDGTKAQLTEQPFSARPPSRTIGTRQRPIVAFRPRYSADKRPVKGFLLGNRALNPGEGTAPTTRANRPRRRRRPEALRPRSPWRGWCSAPARTAAPDLPALATRHQRPGSRESRRGLRPWQSNAGAHRSAGTPARRCRTRAASDRPTPRDDRPTPSSARHSPRGRRSRPPAPQLAAPHRRPRVLANWSGKPLHSAERSKEVTVHYRWHPLYGQIARVNRGVPRGNDELLFCELPDGTRGTLPSWMTDAAACAVLTVGKPVVAITALQELRLLLDAVARGSDPTDASMPSKEGCDAPKEFVDPHTGTAVPARRARAPHRAGCPTAAGADPSVGRAVTARRGRRQRDGKGGRA